MLETISVYPPSNDIYPLSEAYVIAEINSYINNEQDYLDALMSEILISNDIITLRAAEVSSAEVSLAAALQTSEDAEITQAASSSLLADAQIILADSTSSVNDYLATNPSIDPNDVSTWDATFTNLYETKVDAQINLDYFTFTNDVASQVVLDAYTQVSDMEFYLADCIADLAAEQSRALALSNTDPINPGSLQRTSSRINDAQALLSIISDEFIEHYEALDYEIEILNDYLQGNGTLTNEEVLTAINGIIPDDDGISELFTATLSAKNPNDVNAFTNSALSPVNDPSTEQLNDFLFSFRNSLNSRTSLITTAQKEEILSILPYTEGNGIYDYGETFVDSLNGVYDVGEEFLDVADGVYNEGEPFVDLGNGIYDEGETFTDLNGNGQFDEYINPSAPIDILLPWPGPPEMPPYQEKFTYQWYYPIPGNSKGFPIPEQYGGKNAFYNIQGIKSNEGIWRVEVTDHDPENWFIIYDGDELVFNFDRYVDILEGNEVSRCWLPGIGWSITRSHSFEVKVVKDSDDDGLYDYIETDTGIYVSPKDTGTNPYNYDTDFDTLSDGDEISLGTNPNLFDTDNDGLSDSVETNTGNFLSIEDTGTDPNLFDTSGDGLKDGAVVGIGYDPNVDYSPLLNLNSINMLQDIKDLRPGSVTIQVVDGEANINMDIESSTDLENWEIDSAITVPMPIEDGEATKFFRFRMSE